MEAPRYEALDGLERCIAAHLVNRFRYSSDDAARLWREYAPVLELLPRPIKHEDYAVWIRQADANGLTPEQWSARLHSLVRPRIDDESSAQRT